MSPGRSDESWEVEDEKVSVDPLELTLERACLLAEESTWVVGGIMMLPER